MENIFSGTLFDSVRDRKESWEQMVFEAVTKSLVDLGDNVYSVEWADKYRNAVLQARDAA